MTPVTEPGQAGTRTAELLRAITAELADTYWERSAAVRALVTAMLAGQHSLLLGPPGTGKSALARDLAGRIDGARYWEILLSKFTDPKRMFGPVDGCQPGTEITRIEWRYLDRPGQLDKNARPPQGMIPVDTANGMLPRDRDRRPASPPGGVTRKGAP
jgi:hypothetical protein